MNTSVFEIIKRSVVAMISWSISSSPREVVFPNLLYSDSRYSQTGHQGSQLLPGLLSAFPNLSPVFPGALQDLSHTPNCSQICQNQSHGTSIPAISNSRYSEWQEQYPPRAWYSAEIDTSKFTLHILSDPPCDFEWLQSILLIQKAAINYCSGYTLRLWSSVLRDGLWYRDNWLWRHNWSHELSEIGNTPGGYHRARLVNYLEAVDGLCARCSASIHQLFNLQPLHCGMVTIPVSTYVQLTDSGETDRVVHRELVLHSVVNSWSWEWSTDKYPSADAVLRVYCTWCILYSVNAVLWECCTQCKRYSVYAILTICCTQCMLYFGSIHDYNMEKWRAMI